MFLAIEGPIAAGKSTTATLVARELGWPLVLERVSNHPFLEQFYSGQREVALETELSFILGHYNQLRAVGKVHDLVSDFSPGKDYVFGQLNLKGEDWEIFERVYERLILRVAVPDLVVLLDVPIDELFRRVTVRGRSFEVGLTKDYLAKLMKLYESHIRRLGPQTRVIRVEPGQRDIDVASAVLAVLQAEDPLGSTRLRRGFEGN